MAKFGGGLWEAEIDHSPLDIVAWRGNYVPFKYDLNRFQCINTVTFDHPGSVDLLRAGVADGGAGHVERRVRLLPAALDRWPSTRSVRRRSTATWPASSSG